MEMNFDIKARTEAVYAKIKQLFGVVHEVKEEAEEAGKSISGALNDSVIGRHLPKKIEDVKVAIDDTTESVEKQTEKLDKQASSLDKVNKEVEGYLDGQKEAQKTEEEQAEKLGKQAENQGEVNKEINRYVEEKNKAQEADEKHNRTLVQLLGGQEQYNKILSSLPPEVRGVISAIDGMTASARAFIATPLGAVLAAITLALSALFTWFKNSEEGEMAFAKATGYVSGVLNQLKEIAISVGKAIYNAFTDPQQAVKDLWNAIKTNIVNRLDGLGQTFMVLGKMVGSIFSGNFDSGEWATMGKELADATAAVVTGVDKMTDRVENFTKKTHEAAVASAKLNEREKTLARERSKWSTEEQKIDNELAKLRNSNASGGNRQANAARAEELVNQKYAKRLEFAKEELAIQKGLMELTTNTDADYERLHSLEREVLAIEQQRTNEMLRFNRAAQAGAMASTRQQAKQEKADAEYLQASVDLQNKVKDAEIAAMKEGEAKVRAEIKQSYEKRLDEINKAEKKYLEQKKKDKGTNAVLDESETELFSRMRSAAAASRDKELKEVEKREDQDRMAYLEKYGDFQEQRLAVAEKYDKLIAEAANKYQALSLEQQKQSALQQLSLEQFRKNPNFTMAFNDPNSASIEVLRGLVKEFEAKAREGALGGLDIDELQAWMDAALQMFDNIVARDPFTALKVSTEELITAQADLSASQQKLNLMQTQDQRFIKNVKTENGKLVVTYLTERDVLKEIATNQNRVTQAQNKQNKATREVRDEVDKLAGSIKDIGKAIGGTEGEILDCIAQTMTFVTSTITSMEHLAEITASSISSTMKAIESASVILAIVGMAIQLMQAVSTLAKSEQDYYEAAVKKQAQINAMRDSVNEYAIAVAEANKHEKEWFATTGGASLKNQWEVSENAAEAYFNKLHEKQQEYTNEGGGGWLTTFFNFTSKLGRDIGGGFGYLGEVGKWILNPLGSATDKVSKQINDALSDEQKFNESLIEAVDNLRIETKEKSKGFLGTGIGGHAQETKDLVTWVRETYNKELFNDDGWINVALADQVLKDYGDKLVGETQKTIESLKEYKEKYDEFREALEDMVGEMFSPLADNLTDALWDWYKDGTDTLDRFKEYASDTFEAIAKDAVKSAVLNKLFDSYSKDIADIYEKYATKSMSEEELARAVAEETGRLTGQIESSLPALQAMTQSIGDAFAAAGYASVAGSDQFAASQRSVAAMSEDTANELNGRFLSLQLTGESINQLMQQNVQALEAIHGSITDGVGILGDINTNILACNSTLNSIYNANINGFSNVSDELKRVVTAISDKM